MIRKALHPYPDDLCIVTKVSARRDEKGNWLPAMSPAELTQAVEDNLRHLGLEVLEVVNLRSMLSPHGPVEGSLEAPLATLLELKERGLIRHIGLSNVTAKQVADAQKMTPIVCVQNLYNVAHRADDALVDALVTFLSRNHHNVIIEGVESEAHKEWLQGMEWFAIQGHYWREVSIEQLVADDIAM